MEEPRATDQTSTTSKQPASSQPASEPLALQPISPAPETKPKKKRKTLLFVAIGIVLCAAFVSVLWFINRDKTSAPADSSATANIEQTDEVVVESNGITYRRVQVTDNLMDGMIVYYEPTKRYITLPLLKEQSFWANIENDTLNLVTLEEVVRDRTQAIVNDGYAPLTPTDNILASIPVNSGQSSWFKKDDIVCELVVIGTDERASSVRYSCSDTLRTEELAAAMEPFFVAYEKSSDYEQSDKSKPYRIVVYPERIKDSQFEGYQYAYGGVGELPVGAGAGVVFVRQGDEPWVFFAGRQAIMPCEAYDTELSQKALAHEECFANGSNSSTVKSFYNL